MTTPYIDKNNNVIIDVSKAVCPECGGDISMARWREFGMCEKCWDKDGDDLNED